MIFSSVVEAVAWWGRHEPGRPAIVAPGPVQTYGDLWGGAVRAAACFSRMPLERGGRVVVRVAGPAETLAAALGIHLAGGVFVPVETKAGPERLAELAGLVGAKVVVGAAGTVGEVAAVGWDALRQDPEAAGAGRPGPKPDDLSEILFTSGSTGRPKGVMLSFRTQTATAADMAKVINFTAGDVLLLTTPLDHCGALQKAYMAFLAGGAIAYSRGVFIKEFFHLIWDCGVNFIGLTPSWLNLLLQTAADQLAGLRGQLKAIYSIGAAASREQQSQLRELLPGTRLYVNYGCTEAASLCSLEFSRGPAETGCLGWPTGRLEIFLVNDQGQPLERTGPDQPGIIACEARDVMTGYWNEPDLTARAFQNGNLLLSDLGFRAADGSIHFVARRDDLINCGGYKISPAEIEDKALTFPGVKECVCVGLDDAVMGQTPKLYVVMQEGVELTQRELHLFLAERLESYKVPKLMEQLDELPKTGALGKIKRHELKRR